MFFQFQGYMESTKEEILVVFIGHENSDKKFAINNIIDLGKYFKEARMPPLYLLFVCPLGIQEDLKTWCEKCEEFIGRLKTVEHFLIAPFNIEGKLVKDKIEYIKEKNNDRWNVSDKFIEGFAESAFKKILEDTESIIYAPHGYVFKKPSKATSKYFVQTGNMLNEPNCIALFSYLILRHMPKDCRTIFVDSITILSFALGVQSLVGYFKGKGEELQMVEIENFYSYNFSKKKKLDGISGRDDYLILISATASKEGLQKRLMNARGAKKASILHIRSQMYLGTKRQLGAPNG